jgi:dipeptidyl aminopeptidase/acylaminoacyl peptidase
VLVLIHRGYSSRRDFKSFIPNLLDEGFSVLAYDVRGSGKTGGFEAKPEDTYLDVVAALDFLEANPDIDMSRVCIIGLAMGANIALAGASADDRVRCVVAVSPNQQANLIISTIEAPVPPKNVFAMTTENEREEAQSIMSKARDPKVVRVYGTSISGIELLSDKDRFAEAMDFIWNSLGR